jgi:adenosine deaminase
MSSLQAPALRRLIEAMPKAELHLHLDGSLRVDTALELAHSRGVDAPRDWGGMFAALVAPARGASQAELLRAFDLPISLMQDAEALERVAYELVEAKAADGVRYLELRWGPLLHIARGLPLADGIAAVVRGGTLAGERYGVTVHFIATALRSHEPAANRRLAETAARFRDRGLTGFDLAGPEEAFPDPLDHKDAFEAAREGRLGVTVHAGEWGGAAQVMRALELEPDRIAHGAPAIDDPILVRHLIARGVTLDLCPSSNVQAGVVTSLESHPLARLHRAGVSVTLSTDDSTVSNVSLSDEYERALTRLGLSLPELWAIDKRALQVAFAAQRTIAEITTELDDWAAQIPELAPEPSG